jgi:hypothetical protein
MDNAKIAALTAEFHRLGLDPHELPGLSVAAGHYEALIAHLRSLAPGITWHEALPGFPKHWIPGKPETWTVPYRPFGPYDYQTLPTGPAVHVCWEKPGAPDQLDRLVAAAKAAGWPIYGAGWIDTTNPKWRTVDAMIVLRAGTDGDALGDFLSWLEEQRVRIAAVPRRGDEEYLS